MEQINQQLETENCALIERITGIEAENHRLNLDNDALKKSLEKQKNLYRNFSKEVIESERLRSEAFKLEQKSLLEKKQSLAKENRQLKKDFLFYKEAYKELDKEDKSVPTEHQNQQSENVTKELSKENESRNQARSASTPDSMQSSANKINRAKKVTPQRGRKSGSSKTILKLNERLYIENKKLKLKISSLSSTVVFMKRKNNQLENWKKKMSNNRLRSLQDINELNRLAESTESKNKDIYTPEILAKLDELSK